MLMDKMLDIIIPAYKSEFLLETLDCFQTVCPQFDQINVLIFCDGVNPKIDHITSLFPDFYYHRFMDNLGGRDLVGHWMRCLTHSTSEYVWLFSDDDTIKASQLTQVLKHLTTSKNRADCYRLRVDRIDTNSNTLNVELNTFIQDYLSFDGYTLLTAKFKHHYDNVIPNFIFRRSLLNHGIKMRKLPFAWMSDDIFWFDIANSSVTCQLPYTISWRLSDLNISSSGSHKFKKMAALTSGVAYLCLNGLVNKKFLFLLHTIKWYLKSLWRTL